MARYFVLPAYPPSELARLPLVLALVSGSGLGHAGSCGERSAREAARELKDSGILSRPWLAERSDVLPIEEDLLSELRKSPNQGLHFGGIGRSTPRLLGEAC